MAEPVVGQHGEEKNPYLDSDAAFVHQHTDSNGIVSDTTKNNLQPNGPIAPMRHPSPHLSMDDEEEEKYEYYEYPSYSVESGLHALLASLNLPIASHVLITSLVSPSIIRIIELHGLIAKPIDIDLERMAPTTNIQELITKQTKLIIVRHLFGFTIPINITRSDADALHDILIIEDCSDLDRDTDANSEYTAADIKMYSLHDSNGAMFKFKDESLLKRLENISHTYRKQNSFMFLWSLMICCNQLTLTSDMSTKQFMSSLELQPCSYLIARINCKRKRKKKHKEAMHKKRSAMLSSLTAITDIVIVGKSCDAESFCGLHAFPVLIGNRSRVMRGMTHLGYNMSASAHELMAVEGSANANHFLSNVLYLPVRALNLKSFSKMLSDLNKIINKRSRSMATHKTRCGVLSCASVQLVMKILVVLLVLRYIWLYLCIVLSISYYFLRPTNKFRDTPYIGVKHKRVCSKTKITAVITGATGFLGDVLVKDLLDSYPSDLIKLYLIIRGKKKLSAHQRARQLFGDALDNIVVIDAELDTLNIDDIDADQGITHVIHSAANVKFSEAHSSIASTNISCSLKMKKLADKYNAKFIYISTAFVHGADSSKTTNYLHASPYWLPDNDLSAQKLYHLMLGDGRQVDAYMKRNHIENNYILSKIIAENIIGSTSIIIRPSIITPSWNFPEPGWGGSAPSTVTLVIAGVAGRLLRCVGHFSLTQSKPMPVIPVDFVTKCIIDHMDSCDKSIYLAALNTETKYNKVCSWYELTFILSSYLYCMEMITGLEAVLIRLSSILASFNVYLFRFIGYIMNELFAPQKYKPLLDMIYQIRHFGHTSFCVENGITPHTDFDGKKYVTIMGEASAQLIKKPIYDLKDNIPFKFDENILISIMNTCFSLILRKTTNTVTVDTAKLKELSQASKNANIVLLPTHRSFYDFLLICKLCLKYKAYGLSMPLSFATSKFKQSPLIAMCMTMMNTIFIDAGCNNIGNGFLRKKIKENKDCNNVYQLFIEGRRSRNRQFLVGHHGVLSTLAETMDLCIVPITINYERVAEQNSFYRELDGEKSSFSVIDLLGWLYDVVFKNNVFLGDIHIVVGDLIECKQREYNKEYFSNLVNHIQLKQMEMVHITAYHLHHFNCDNSDICEFLKQSGCEVYPTTLPLNDLQMNDKDVYINTLQFAHFLADYMDLNTKCWLTNGTFVSTKRIKISFQQKEFIQSIITIIDRYRSFISLSDTASASTRLSVGEESLGYWGYSDCYFQLKEDKLFFKGSRYELSDQYFDATISLLSKICNIPLLRKKKCFPVLNHAERHTHTHTHSKDELMPFLNDLFGVKHISTDINIRCRHGTGHTVSDMLHLRISNTRFRIPDIVVYPTCSSQIVQLVENCVSLNVCLIPYGGGTNVTHALWCDINEKRKIISVDMSLMNKLIWMNRENQTAHVMCGITGKKLESELNSCGFTTGHYPDSYEFSTLGGWIATFASGMKRTKYGNIEDIVIDFEVVTTAGLVSRNMCVYGRVAAGTNPLSVLFGSEGTLGIIVSAVVRLHKIPDIISYDSILFPNWSDGVHLMKMVRNIAANCRPASLRLVDNTQFRLSQTFKEKHKWSFLSKLYVTKWKGFDSELVCAATIVYEGTQNEINVQKKIINKLIAQNKGIRGGEASGKAGFNVTFAIAYIRDFLLETFGVLAESFETFVPWDKVDNFKPKLHDSILRKHQSMGLIGNPFLSSRISQVYNEGVCLYLYYGFYVESLNRYALTTFDEMEDFIRKQMLKYGASISHHHGIGKLRADILKNDISSKQMIDLTRNVKSAFDPNNIFCANNGLCAE